MSRIQDTRPAHVSDECGSEDPDLYATHRRPAMKPLHTNLILTASALALSIVSFVVVNQGASDEPYSSFRWSDAVVQVGVAIVLMLLWFQLAVGIMAGVARRRVSPWWLPLLLWVLICEFYLSCCPIGLC